MTTCKALQPAKRRGSLDVTPAPLVGLLREGVNVVVVGVALFLALVMRAFALIPALLLLDVLALACFLCIPSRRENTVRRLRHRRRAMISPQLRCNDRLQWVELEETVKTTRPSLAPRRCYELEQLLDLYVDVGVHAARWESQIERFGRLPAGKTADPIASLVQARGERRTHAQQALESLTAQLSTLSTLILLGCEDAVAARVRTIAGDLGAHVEEARRSAQSAIEASEEVDRGWDALQPVEA